MSISALLKNINAVPGIEATIFASPVKFFFSFFLPLVILVEEEHITYVVSGSDDTHIGVLVVQIFLRLGISLLASDAVLDPSPSASRLPSVRSRMGGPCSSSCSVN